MCPAALVTILSLPGEHDNVAEVAHGAEHAQHYGDVGVDGPVEVVDAEQPFVYDALARQLHNYLQRMR